MTADDRRSALLQAFRDSRAALLAAIDGLSEEQTATPAADGWSAKDHLIHVGHMDELRFFEIKRVSNGLRPAWPSATEEQSDRLNALGVQARRALPLNEVLAGLDLTRALVLDAIANAPADALDGSRYGEFGLDGGVRHEQEHAAAIRALRSRQGR